MIIVILADQYHRHSQSSNHHEGNNIVTIIVHLKCKEPRGSESVRADPGRGENNVTRAVL